MKLVMLGAMLMLALPDTARAPSSGSTPASQRSAMPNVLTTPEGCQSIPQQVAGENRRYPGTRLDQQPPGRVLHAVDRQVDGCREVTFVNEQRR